MLKFNYSPRVLREHPVLTRVLVLGFTAFLCCFAFPLGSTVLFQRVLIFGMLSLCLAEAYGPGKEPGVFLRTLAAAGLGLLGRYLLEYGEVSNTRNFTVENVLWFLAAVPLCMVLAYHVLVKWLSEHPASGQAR